MSADIDRVRAALVAKYDVQRELGAGGMAAVFLARDRKHDRHVAVKVLHPELGAAVGGTRFLHEIALTANLNHPHILSLIDSGEADGLLYYVMPYIEGESLRQRLERERQLGIDESIEITRQIAQALEYAHGRDIVHRDVKPDNILLSGDQAVLADFGIAHGVTEAGGERVTATGIAVGTVEYMSPEQSVGERDIDNRTDVYALGCVLYEMLVGEPPFTGPNTHAVMARKSLDAVPSIRTVRDTVPEGIDASVAKALARTRADRYRTAADFAAALAEPDKQVSRKTKRNGVGATLFGVTAMVLIGMLAVWWWPGRAGSSTVLPEGSTIAVIPLAPSSPDADLSRLGRDLVTTVSHNLTGIGGVRAANPQAILSLAGQPGDPFTLEESVSLAAQVGASSFLHGAVLRRGSNAQAIIALYNTNDTTELARTSVTASPEDVAVFADSISVDILRQIWRRGRPLTPSLTTTLTGSPEALRHYVEGELAFAENRWDDAEVAYANAFRADSAFWLASFKYAYVKTGWTQDTPADTVVLQAFHPHVDSLPEPYRSWLDVAGRSFGLDDYLYADSAGSRQLAAYELLANRYPDYWQIFFDYADALNHYGSLFGVSGDEALDAWRRLADRHPALISSSAAGPRKEFGSGWFHVLWLSMPRDSAFTVRAMEGLLSASGQVEHSPYARLFHAAMWETYDTLLIDTVNATRLATTNTFWHQNFWWGVSLFGLPQLQVDLSDRKLLQDPIPTVAAWHHIGRGSAFAARGAWDSALVATDRAFRRVQEGRIPLWRYRIAAAGASLGFVDPKEAVNRRPDTTAFESGPAWWREEMAWLDGLVAIARRDAESLAAARSWLARLGADSVPQLTYLDESLAALELGVRGETAAAGDALYRVEYLRTGRESYGAQWWWAGLNFEHPFLQSVNRMAGAQWLLAEADTARAVRLLGWHAGNQLFAEVVAYAFVAAVGYRELALIAEAQGRTHDAILYYREFLRRYDMPPPEHRQWVTDANEALVRLTTSDQPVD